MAWRNVWRRKLRSGVLITSISLGIWAGVFVLGLSVGVANQRRDAIIHSTISHIQIHTPEFLRGNSLTDTLPDYASLEKALEASEGLKASAPRLILNGMASTSRGGFGVRILGVDPEREKAVSTIYQKMVEGAWFTSDKKASIVLGEKLAERLKINLNSKVVLTFQSASHEIIAGAFRVRGIYKSISTKYDERHVYVRRFDLEGLLGKPWAPVEVAVMSRLFQNIEGDAERLRERFPGLSVRTWKEISPELGYQEDVLDQWMYIFLSIILLALAFGIINTMLMAILERRKELGMLMAVGMRRGRVFWMVMAETLFLCLAGGPLGIALGFGTIEVFARRGIDLSIVKEGLESYGMQTVIYPELSNDYYLNVLLMIIATAFLAGIYPAWKALRNNPTEALRSH